MPPPKGFFYINNSSGGYYNSIGLKNEHDNKDNNSKQSWQKQTEWQQKLEANRQKLLQFDGEIEQKRKLLDKLNNEIDELSQLKPFGKPGKS